MPALQNTFKAELIKRYHNKYELRVTGDVTEPTTGWQVDLDPASFVDFEQGIARTHNCAGERPRRSHVIS
jgi:hypothetical protein